MNHKTYLKVEDVAERFGVNVATVYRLAQQKKLPGFKVGGQWRFEPRRLDDWVATQIDFPATGTD
jgi:excisionase family DNA binding protein